MTTQPLTVLLAEPRGFCAGVDRAIQIVEKAIEHYGAPVYVRHEIVHNKFVVNDLKAKGAVFVEELDEIPDNGRPVIFSAHGVAKSVPDEARRRAMFFIDATCPLVTKVHNEAIRHHQMGRHILLIGHAGHPEVAGTMGQLPQGAIQLIETVADVQTVRVPDAAALSYCTQTTLSVDDTRGVIDALKARFPSIIGPGKEDICYATTNRQEAVKAMAPQADHVYVIGAPNSSNSNRLVEVALAYGCPRAQLIQTVADIDFADLRDVRTLGLTAGASAPEILMQQVLDALKTHYDIRIQTIRTATENVVFNIPAILRQAESRRAS